MTGLIGVSIGDVTGIGPEVTLKALAKENAADDTRYLLIGNDKSLWFHNHKLQLGLDLQPYSAGKGKGRLLVLDPYQELSGPENLPPGDPRSADAALSYLTEGAQRCLRQELDALVTAPVNKEAILRTGRRFTGQTELLSEMAGTARTAMMLIGCDEQGRWLRVALVTTHLPVKQVAESLTQSKIQEVIELATQACHDLGLERARVGVCGLNPHAGEGGQLGMEEITTIRPAVEAARQSGLDVHGPFAADTLFYQAYNGSYDAVVAMYHDQGLVPLKMIGFQNGVNWTLGLPFIRTSPDHGTGYDIAGKGIADPSSMQAALQLAKKLIRSRGNVPAAAAD